MKGTLEITEEDIKAAILLYATQTGWRVTGPVQLTATALSDFRDSPTGDHRITASITVENNKGGGDEFPR